ncbi:MAG: 4-hydroxythreonine-4-phosphate dehydrogenase PdxA [Desulfobacteraceae bacterium]|nr:4-hydroxythreonine-4-phosphate dehydrogenase PdxA [Desulfobacteraceae bacterium]
MEKPIILITMGDPAGVGPEIILKALKDESIHEICKPVIVGSTFVMKKASKDFSMDFNFTPYNSTNNTDIKKTIEIIESGRPIENFSYSDPFPETGENVYSYIKDSIDLCMKKEAQAIATAPISKTTLKKSDINFQGHTEILAYHSGTAEYAMMMHGKDLCVILVTIHIALKDVPLSISTEKIFNKIVLSDISLKQRFGIKNPRIAVCGLNPHAGEDSLFGDEEEKIIIPAVKKAQKIGINVSEPLPPDTVFFQAKNKKFDCVLSMYHDQGLIPFKLLHFEDGVNTTLGLPFPRTSVDHGTAYDIAGKNIANPKSMIEAIKLAAVQSSNMKKYLQ